MNVACDYEAPMQMLTTEKYIAAGPVSTNNYGWEYFGCSNNCLAPNVTIFSKMQFSGKRIKVFSIFFSICFWGINRTLITNFWHNRDKLTQLFCVVKKMTLKSRWLCVQKFIAR